MASPRSGQNAAETLSPDLSEVRNAIENLPADQQAALSKWLRGRRSRLLREKRTADSEKPFFRSSALRWTIMSLLAFLLVDAAIFRLGWYYKYLEPNSSAGEVESYLYWLKSNPPSNAPEVMVVGDSRIAEGFSSRAADSATGSRIRFWNLGMGGTTPRVWYYALRDADPSRRRFKAIVMALDQYSDEDRWDSAPNRLIDLNFLVGRLRLTDCPSFAWSMQTWDYREKALAGCLFKGIPLRRDVQEFLPNIRDRIKRSKDWRNNGILYTTDYPGRLENLEGLSADFVHRTLVFPPGLDQLRHDSIQAMVMPPPALQTGENRRYRELWLGRIIDLYKDSPTRIIFLELPRAPVPKPDSPLPATFLESAVRRPRVSALPSSTFRFLERPEYFFDGLHLNKAGRGLFSAKIAETIPPRIGIE